MHRIDRARPSRALGFLLLLVAALATACGDGQEAAPEAEPAAAPAPPISPEPPAPEPPSAPAPAAAVTPPAAPVAVPEPAAPGPGEDAGGPIQDDGTTVSVALTGSDALQYSLNEIRIAEGRRVKLTLTHIGQGPKESMGHNFVLLSAGTEVTAFGLAAASARDTGYIPASMKDAVLANTEVIGGGESTTIEFDAPPPGTYDYMCSFTGHFGTMRGKLIVE
ncbi:MAG: plastocyanin/azurin family copper-binding protein [Myxococcota bacterium]